MSLFDKIFRPQKIVAAQYFKTLTAYEPRFRSWRGCIYESELVRSTIDAKARSISKLSVKITGAAKPRLQTILKKRPNQYQTWSQFLYRASTILDMENNVFKPILSPLSDNDKIFLKAMARQGETVSTAKLQGALGKRGPAIQPYRKRLLDAGVIEAPRRGELVFAVPYLAEYLQNQ